MGTIIGSIYPLDNIVFEQGSYLNSTNTPEKVSAGQQTSNTGMVALAGGLNNAVSSVLLKYGAMPPKPLDTMTVSELRSYKKILESALIASKSDTDKNVINIQIAKVDSELKRAQKEKTNNIFRSIWDGLVFASGVQSKPESEKFPDGNNSPAGNNSYTNNKEKNKKNTKKIFIGVGIGVGVLLIGTITYLAIKKK